MTANTLIRANAVHDGPLDAKKSVYVWYCQNIHSFLLLLLLRLSLSTQKVKSTPRQMDPIGQSHLEKVDLTVRRCEAAVHLTNTGDTSDSVPPKDRGTWKLHRRECHQRRRSQSQTRHFFCLARTSQTKPKSQSDPAFITYSQTHTLPFTALPMLPNAQCQHNVVVVVFDVNLLLASI